MCFYVDSLEPPTTTYNNSTISDSFALLYNSLVVALLILNQKLLHWEMPSDTLFKGLPVHLFGTKAYPTLSR